MKCNPDPDVLACVKAAGASFEIAGLEELESLLRIGVPAEEIIFSNPVKMAEHIRRAFDAGVRRFAFDSVDELQKLARNAPGASVHVRLRTLDITSVVPSEGKFGVAPLQAADLMQDARRSGPGPVRDRVPRRIADARPELVDGRHHGERDADAPPRHRGHPDRDARHRRRLPRPVRGQRTRPGRHRRGDHGRVGRAPALSGGPDRDGTGAGPRRRRGRHGRDGHRRSGARQHALAASGRRRVQRDDGVTRDRATGCAIR